MRFIHALTAAILTGIIGFLATMTCIGMYFEFLTNATYEFPDGLFILFTALLVFPILTIILAVFFFIKYNRINMTGIIFAGITGLWLIRAINEIVPWMSYSKGIGDMFNTSYLSYLNILLVLFWILGYLFVHPTSKWIHINGFLLGAFSSLVLSYVVVIILRGLNNSLTSFFHFNFQETLFVLLCIFAGTIIGNWIGKRKTE